VVIKVTKLEYSQAT